MTAIVDLYAAINPSSTYTFGSGDTPSTQGSILGLLNPADQLVKQLGFPGQADPMLGSEVRDALRAYRASFMVLAPQRDVRAVFEERVTAVLRAVFTGKKQLGSRKVGATGKVGIYVQPIRPMVAYHGTATQDWVVNGQAAGWATKYFDWNLNASTAPILQDRAVILNMGLADLASSPKVQESQLLDPDGDNQGVQSYPFSGAFDTTNIFLWDTAFYQAKASEWTEDINFGVGGNTIPVPLGVQVVDSVLGVDEKA